MENVAVVDCLQKAEGYELVRVAMVLAGLETVQRYLIIARQSKKGKEIVPVNF